MFCPNCGTKVDDGAAFCPNCGTPIKMEAPGSDWNAGAGAQNGSQTGDGSYAGYTGAGDTTGTGFRAADPVTGRKSGSGKSFLDKLPFPKKFLPLIVAIIVVVIVVIAVAANGGGYRSAISKQINDFNKQETNVETIIRHTMPSNTASAAISLLHDMQNSDAVEDAGLSISAEDLEEALQDRYDEAEDAYDDDYKITYSISNVKNIDKDDLKDLQENFQESYSDTYDELDDYDTEDLEDLADDNDIDVSEVRMFVNDVKAIVKTFANAKVTGGKTMTVRFEGAGDDRIKAKVTVYKINGTWVIGSVDYTDRSPAVEFLSDWASLLSSLY